MAKLLNRRPHYMVTVHYEEPERGYALKLFCGCGIDPPTGRIVEVFVRPARIHDGEAPDHRDALMERLCDDIGRLVSFHLQAGETARHLAARLEAGTAGPGTATFPERRGAVALANLSSPIGAIAAAAALAEADWQVMHEQLGRAGVVVVAHA